MALTKVTGQVIKNTTDVTVGVLTVTNTLAVGGTVSIGGTLTYEDVTNVDAVGLVTARNGIVVGSGITLSKDGDGFFTGVTTATTFVGSFTGDVTGAASQITVTDESSDTSAFVVLSNTATGNNAPKTGSNLTFNSSSGALTATSFVGSGANLTNLDASDLASGTVPTARLGSGTASSSTFLRGDSTFAAVTSTTINNNADNRVITGSGTANTLEAEANLTFTGSILTVTNSSGASELTLVTPNNTDGGVYFNDGSNAGALTYQHSDNSMRFRVNSTEKVRITSDGHFGIGDTTPAEILTIRDATPRIRLEDSDTTNAACQFVGDNASVLIQADTAGVVSDSTISFAVDGGEVARFDSAGRMGIKNTSPSSFNTGMDDLVIGNGVNGTSPGMTIFSNSSDIGSISFRDSADTGISGLIQYRHLESPPYMKFMVEGTDTAKFTTHGGIAFGSDTAAANTLDDYEEGQWTPQTHDGSISYQNAKYTKIGRQVTITARIFSFSDNSTNDAVRIKNLPFAAAVTSVAAGSVMYSYGGNSHYTTLYLDAAHSGSLNIYGGHSGAFDQLRHNELNVSAGTTDMYIIATYFTAT